jgi:hypothetical protein
MEIKRYWKLKGEALDRTLWRTCFEKRLWTCRKRLQDYYYDDDGIDICLDIIIEMEYFLGGTDGMFKFT